MRGICAQNRSMTPTPSGMWWSSNSNSTTFELRTFSTDSKFDKCSKHLLSYANLWKSSFHNWLHTVCTDSQIAQSFFFKFNLSHKLQLLKVQHNFCSVMCYIVVRTMILLTLGNNIVTGTLIFNWPVHTFRLMGKCLYLHSHSTNSKSQNSNLMNAYFDQLLHITTLHTPGCTQRVVLIWKFSTSSK